MRIEYVGYECAIEDAGIPVDPYACHPGRKRVEGGQRRQETFGQHP